MSNNHCLVCGHRRDIHMMVCGEKDCGCLCFLPEQSPDDSPPITEWQEKALMAVMDLVLEEREGEVAIQTRRGQECRVQVRFVPELGMSITGIGRVQ